MIHWLNRLLTRWREPPCPGAEIMPAPTDWDVATAAESEPGRVAYKWLGMTGEEEG